MKQLHEQLVLFEVTFPYMYIHVLLNFAFGQVGEKKFIAKTAITIDIAAISQTFYNINTLLDLFTNVVGDKTFVYLETTYFSSSHF
jgi:predicted DNA-binding protein YlxM (UPF0122 family)